MAGLPPLPLSQASVDRVIAAAKDLTYITVGFAVLGFQQAQVRRREIEKVLGCSGRGSAQAK